MGKAKGTTIINAIKTLRENKEAAWKALPEHLRWYLDQRILVSSWYPDEDVLEILRALAKVLPDPGMDVYEFMGRRSARADLGGVYSHLLRPGDPAATMRRAAILWTNYHDSGKEEVVAAGNNYAALELSGYDHPSREGCKTLVGWNYELAVMAGGKDVRVVHAWCVLDGAKACRFEVTWTQ
jgi:hypothetical protein